MPRNSCASCPARGRDLPDYLDFVAGNLAGYQLCFGGTIYQVDLKDFGKIIEFKDTKSKNVKTIKRKPDCLTTINEFISLKNYTTYLH